MAFFIFLILFLFKTKIKNYHISIVLYSIDNVSTAVYFSTTVKRDIVINSEWQQRDKTRNSSDDPDTPPYQTFPPSDLKSTLPVPGNQEQNQLLSFYSRQQNQLLSFYCVTGFCDTETETSDKIKIVT